MMMIKLQSSGSDYRNDLAEDMDFWFSSAGAGMMGQKPSEQRYNALQVADEEAWSEALSEPEAPQAQTLPPPTRAEVQAENIRVESDLNTLVSRYADEDYPEGQRTLTARLDLY
jgi:hypothetical protein